MPVNKRSTLDNSGLARGSRQALRGLAVHLVASLAVAFGGLPAHADDDAPEHHVEPPPAPADHGGTLSVEVHGGAQVPLARDAICPSTARQCVLGLGLGVGAQIEWRTADRIGLFAAYDFWMIDSGSVYELGTLHAVRGGVRYTIDDSMVVHPFVDLAIGMLAFGDTQAVATAGGVVTAGGGAEFELSESVLFVASAEAWMFATGPFATRDGVTRAADFGVNVALQLSIGVSILIGPSVVPP